jgi:hypothetical protein
MSFVPRVALREGSKGDRSRPPKWFKLALGETVEANGVLTYSPSQHPALASFGIRELGPVGDPATMQRMELTYREAQTIKKTWKAERKTARAARMAGRLKAAA